MYDGSPINIPSRSSLCASDPCPLPTRGVVIFCGCSFVVELGTFSYPGYTASLFATNDAVGNSFAAGTVLFERLLFELGVGKGCAFLGELRIPLAVRFWYLDMYGDK